LQSTALLKQAYDITGRKSDLGWMGLAEFLPIAMLVLISGSVADHFSRKAIALLTVSAEVVTSGLLMLYALNNPTSVTPLFDCRPPEGFRRQFYDVTPDGRFLMVTPTDAWPRSLTLTVSWPQRRQRDR